MAVEVVEKTKGTRTCGDCGGNLAAGVSKCQNCGSTNIKKSLIIIRKAVGDDDDDLPGEIEQLDEEIEELEDESDEDETDDEGDEEDDEDEDDDDDSEEDGEDGGGDEEEPVAPLNTVGKRAMGVEALNLSTALANEVCKIFRGKVSSDSRQAYEDVMTEFNTVFDAAADQWFSGATVSKSSQSKGQLALINKRIMSITKEGGKRMPKKTERPKALDELELPDEVKNYIKTLEGDDEGDDVEKTDIYKGLTPQAAEIVRKSAEVLERDTAKHYMDIAKSLSHVPGDRDKLAKSLRKAAETDEESYNTLLESLNASNENLKQSSIFKSYGSPREGAPNDKIAKRRKDAEELVKKGEYSDLLSAEVSLMGGDDYTPTTRETA